MDSLLATYEHLYNDTRTCNLCDDGDRSICELTVLTHENVLSYCKQHFSSHFYARDGNGENGSDRSIEQWRCEPLEEGNVNFLFHLQCDKVTDKQHRGFVVKQVSDFI